MDVALIPDEVGVKLEDGTELTVAVPDATADEKNRDQERFFCPFPGCNRSFAELWRLKVHYRAPPDIRGSGKERGHGTELGFCPKCAKALKPGKHHVGCSAGRATPRQTKRKASEDAEPESAKLSRGDSLQQQFPWMDQATAQAAAQAAAAAAAAAAASMPMNGGPYAGLMPAHLQHMANGGMPGPGMPYPGPDGANFWSYASQQSNQHHAAAAAAVAAAAAAFASPYGPGYPHNFGVPGFPLPPGALPPPYPPYQPPGMPHPSIPPPPPPQPPLQQQQPAPTPPAPAPSQQHPQQPERGEGFSGRLNHSSHSTPSVSGIESSEPEFLAGIFDDLPEFNRVVPSPPPLPEDFHFNSAPNRMLFNFSQFSQKMPPSLQEAHAQDLTDKEALDLAEQHVVYDHTDDGELMQMLFGMADDMPTMATIHLHAWHNVDDDSGPPPLPQRMGALDAGPHPQAGSSSGGMQQAPHASNGPTMQAAHTQHQQDMRHQHDSQPAGHGSTRRPGAGHSHVPVTDNPHPGGGAAGSGHQASGTDEGKRPEGTGGEFINKHIDIMGNCGDERDHMLDAEMHQFLQSCDS